MSNLERLKQRLEESLEKHKNRLLKTRYKKANGLIDGKAKKSTNNTAEGTKNIDGTKNEITNPGRVKNATVGRDKHPNVYDGNSVRSRLVGRLGSAKAPQVRGKKESNTMASRPLKDKLHCKANSSTRVVRERKTKIDVAKGGVPDRSEANHAMEEDTLEEHPEGDGNFDGVSKEIRDNLNDLFRHFINCRINNLYVIHGDRGKLPRGEFSEEGRGVMMIPGVGTNGEVQEGVIGEAAGQRNELDAAFPNVDQVGCEDDTRGEEEGLYRRLFNVNGERVVNGVSRKGETHKETQLIGADVKRGGKNESIMADGRVTLSNESIGADIGSGRYNSTFVKLMQIKKKIKKKIEKFEDEGNKLFCTDERTVCNSDASNEERNLPVRDVSTFTDGNAASSKGFNHWGVVQVDSSVASAASTNQEVSSTGESIELFTTQKNIFVCNYYTKKSRRKDRFNGRKAQDGVHVVSDAANFLGSAFSLASHSTAMCDVGGSHSERYQSGTYQSGGYPSGGYPSEGYPSEEYEAHFSPHKLYGSPTYRLEHKREPWKRSSIQGKRVTQGRHSTVNRIPNEGEGRRAKRRDDPGKTKYELSSCPSSSLSYQKNYLPPSRGNAFKCLRGQVRRGLSTHMEGGENNRPFPAGGRYAKWESLDRGREPPYPSESRPLGPKRSTTCVQEKSKFEVKNIMQRERNMFNERTDERKERVNRFPIWYLPNGEGVQAPVPVQLDKCNDQLSSAFSGESGGHCSRPGDDPREGTPMNGKRTNAGATPPQLTPSVHHPCEEQAKCYICSFPIGDSEEEFILKKKKKNYQVGRMKKGETYERKEYTSKNCLREGDSLYRRNGCDVSHLPQGDMLIRKGSKNSERGRLRSRQTIHGGSGKYSCMADQEGEVKKMETPGRYMEVHRGEDNGHGTNMTYQSVREDEPDESSFVIDSSGPTHGRNLKWEGSDKREEAIWDGEGFSLQRNIQQGRLQRNIPTCAVKGNDGLNGTRRNSHWSSNAGRISLHEKKCARQDLFPPGVAPRDVDPFSEAYNTWVYKERVSASGERDGVSVGSVIVNEGIREGKPKTLFWKISEGDTFNIPVEGDNAKVLHVGEVLGQRPEERHQGFGTEGGTNRRRAASNGAILKKVLRMKMEAMRREKGNLIGGEAKPRKVTASVGPAPAEYNTNNILNEERNRLREYEKGGRGTQGEGKQTNSRDGEGLVREKLSGQEGEPPRSTGRLSRGTRNSDPPNRLPPSSCVERNVPREMAPAVEACSVRSVSTLERIPSSRHTQRKYSPRGGLTRNEPIRLKRLNTVNTVNPDDRKNEYDMEVERFNESFYCNMKRIRSDDVYPNSEEPISTSQKRRLMKAYLEDLRKKKDNKKVYNYKLKYNIEFFKFAQLICQDKSFCSNYLGQMSSNMDANGDDIDRIAFSIVKLFNAR
ncbi:Uncharacterized protein PCOAH_00015110 [Plasmodium coatneyi]|uniref:Uncharacterized protein n=1 Tax=Plasmodium coatneyi TaxID=208452 RepID=A0A1B1DWM4_9APIC|nr:Uncharacterized protein PCOAH_00015110 [Plasmodium coatneyi]ANQ06985.1 Uncharacterized protein PCOAH_00015110 [Plasmodium coatneyi]